MESDQLMSATHTAYNWEKMDFIADGGFANVFATTKISDGLKVAVK
jgi:hypothetical protein